MATIECRSVLDVDESEQKFTKKAGSKKLLSVGQRSIRRKSHQRRRHKKPKDDEFVSPLTIQVDNPDKNVKTTSDNIPINHHILIPNKDNEDIMKPQEKEDKEDKQDGAHQDDGEDKDNNEDKDGDDDIDDIDPTARLQPTDTTDKSTTKRSLSKKVIPLQCTTRQGTKPRRSKRSLVSVSL